MIAQLEDEGLLTTRDEGGSRLVTITIQGACKTGGAQRAIRRPVRRLRRCAHSPDPRDPLHQLHAAVRQIEVGGDATQLQVAANVLVQARRSLYLILGGRPGWASELKAVPSLVFTDASQLADRFSTAQAQPSS